ncbi:MAG TPA: archaeal heat shock protein Hsp20 [Geobacterales bacterium]|nr:archaeal heat shock protein Hsp20 [Geobacterales bacterium]
MSDEEFSPFWWRRRKYFDDLFKEMERWFEEAMKEMEREFELMPRDLVREKKMGSRTVREFGPFVYGYSITIGPDGKPIIREFGNVRPRGGIRPIEVTDEREPLVDVIEEQDKVRVIAEVPGVSKDEINIEVVNDKLRISTTGKRKYFKEVALGASVDPDSAKATYSNGVLEVVLNKKGEAKESKKIKVE